MDEKNKPEMNPKLREGLGFLGISIVFFIVAIFFFPYIANFFQGVLYVIAIVLFGAAYYPMLDYFRYLKYSKKGSRETSQEKSGDRSFIWIIKKLVGPAILLFITLRFYYEIYDIGIQNFYAPVVGIFVALFLPILCVIYYLQFIRKK